MTDNQKRRFEDHHPDHPLHWDEDATNNEFQALHRRLAAETLRADQGWARADAKSKECAELRERLAAAPASKAQAAPTYEPYAYEEDDGCDMKLVYAEWFRLGMVKMSPDCTYRPLYLAAPAVIDQPTAAEIWALKEEIEHLKQRLEKNHKALFITSQALHNQIVGNQSAWIEWQHGSGAESAMEWIHNGLVGPGLIPDEDEPNGKKPQAWFDEHQDDRYDIPPMKNSAPLSSKEEAPAEVPSTADSGNKGEQA